MDLSKTPAAPPPPGVTPNFDNPEGSEYEIYSISIALCLTATLTLMGRLYTRAVILRAVGLDDCKCCQWWDSRYMELMLGSSRAMYWWSNMCVDLHGPEYHQ